MTDERLAQQKAVDEAAQNFLRAPSVVAALGHGADTVGLRMALEGFVAEIVADLVRRREEAEAQLVGTRKATAGWLDSARLEGRIAGLREAMEIARRAVPAWEGGPPSTLLPSEEEMLHREAAGVAHQITAAILARLAEAQGGPQG